MNSFELTVSITTFANALEFKLTESELMTQLGDMPITLAIQRSIYSINSN